MPTFDHFGLIAPHYDRLASFRRGERLAELLGLPTAGSLLDAAGGTGRVAQQLAPQAGMTVVIDSSRPMLREAAAKPGLAIVQAEVEHMPLVRRSQARIVMVDAFHHLRDQEQALADMARVLAPGGRLVILEPDLHRLGARLVALAERLLLMRSRFRYGEDIARMAIRLGLTSRFQRDGEGSVWIVAERPFGE